MTPYPESHFLLQRHTHAPPQAHQTVTHIQSTSIEAHSGKDKPSLLQIETLKSFVRVCRDTKVQKKSSNAPSELLSCLLIHAKSERNKFIYLWCCSPFNFETPLQLFFNTSNRFTVSNRDKLIYESILKCIYS